MDRWWNRPLGWPFVPSVGWALQGILCCAAGLAAAWFAFRLWQADDSIMRAAGAEDLKYRLPGVAAAALGVGALSLLLARREGRRST